MDSAATLGKGHGAAENKGHLEHAFYTASAAEPQHFPTGYGQSDTRAEKLSDGRSNPSRHAGQPYDTITAADILRMVSDPPSVPKQQAQWFIPSDLPPSSEPLGTGIFWYKR